MNKILSLGLIQWIIVPICFAQQSILNDSNLPIVIITTSEEISDDPKVDGEMKIIYRSEGSRNYLTDVNNADYLNYDGKIKIETRGSSSQALEKKPYGFTTYEADGFTKNNASLLDMPSENDWVLNSLAFDPSMIRDYFSYNYARSLGNYVPRFQYVEVIVNDDYRGVYLLGEKIKIDDDRVNIEKLTKSDNSTPDITGGYIVKADKTTGGDNQVAWEMSSYCWPPRYIFHNPNADDITSQQWGYIENVFSDFKYSMRVSDASSFDNGYPSIIDVPSFVNYMLVAELASNPDAYQFSTFFHKDRNGKLRAGPIWDYNLSFGNDLFDFFVIDENDEGFDRSHTDVWQFTMGNCGSKFWQDLFNDPTFKCYLAKRWFELTADNQPLNYDFLVTQIDSYAALLSESQSREQQRWDRVGEHAENIAAMKVWLKNRMEWMDARMGSTSRCDNIDLPNLVISRIHYHPLEAGAYESKQLEFIEISNLSGQDVSAKGYYIRELGISYQFESDAIIPKGEKIYLCNDASAFNDFYGLEAFGEYTRNLPNSEYHLVLADGFGNIIDEVHYEDENEWPTEADGEGHHLKLQNLSLDNNLATNWVASQEELPTTPTAVLSNQSDADLNSTLRLYPNPTSGILWLKRPANTNGALSLVVHNALGQIIANYELYDNRCDMSELPKGIYFVKVMDESQVLLRTRILKE